jgi:hypothetical protein
MALDADFVKSVVLCLCVFAYNLGEVLRSGLRREALEYRRVSYESQQTAMFNRHYCSYLARLISLSHFGSRKSSQLQFV